MSRRDDLKAFLDGELSPIEMAEMREAIALDADLAREAAQMRAIGDSLRSMAAEPKAVGLDATLAALERARPRPMWLRAWPLAVAAAGLAAVVYPLAQLRNTATRDEVAMQEVATAGSVYAPAELAPEAYVGEADVAKRSAPGPKKWSAAKPAATFAAPTRPEEARTNRRAKGAKDVVRRERTTTAPSGSAKPATSAPKAEDKYARATEAVASAPVVAPVATSVAAETAVGRLDPGEVVEIEVDSPADAERIVRETATALKVGVVAAKSMRAAKATGAERVVRLEVEADRVEAVRERIREVLRPNQANQMRDAAAFQNNQAAQNAQTQNESLGQGLGGAQGGMGGGQGARGGFGGAPSPGTEPALRRMPYAAKGSEPADVRKRTVPKRVSIVVRLKPKPAPKTDPVPAPGTIQP